MYIFHCLNALSMVLLIQNTLTALFLAFFVCARSISTFQVLKYRLFKWYSAMKSAFSRSSRFFFRYWHRLYQSSKAVRSTRSTRNTTACSVFHCESFDNITIKDSIPNWRFEKMNWSACWSVHFFKETIWNRIFSNTKRNSWNSLILIKLSSSTMFNRVHTVFRCNYLAVGVPHFPCHEYSSQQFIFCIPFCCCLLLPKHAMFINLNTSFVKDTAWISNRKMHLAVQTLVSASQTDLSMCWPFFPFARTESSD